MDISRAFRLYSFLLYPFFFPFIAQSDFSSHSVIPIPGCRSRARVQENAAAAHIKLAKEDVQEIRLMVNTLQAWGSRYPEASNAILDVGADSMPLEQWKGE